MSDTTFTPTHAVAVCTADTPGDWLLGFWEDVHVVEHTSGDPNQSVVRFVDGQNPVHLKSLPLKFVRKIPTPTWTENVTSDGTIQYHVPDDWFCPLCFSFQIEDMIAITQEKQGIDYCDVHEISSEHLPYPMPVRLPCCQVVVCQNCLLVEPVISVRSGGAPLARKMRLDFQCPKDRHFGEKNACNKAHNTGKVMIKR